MKWDLSEPVRADKHLPWYLPSINNIFSLAISKTSNEHRPNNPPKSLPVPGQLNFLLKDSFYYYPRCMYSAGMAEHDLTKSLVTDASIRSRDKLNTFILADSGGYQVITNQLDIDWDKPDPTFNKLLKWQEDMTTVGMYLEIPVGVAGIEYFETKDAKGKHTNKKGEKVRRDPNRFYNNKADLLSKTEKSFEYFQLNKSGKIGFLLPIHGSTVEEAIDWYERFKRFDHIGYAVGGHLAKSFACLIAVIDHINRDGGFNDEEGQYFHIFGRGTATPAIAFTVLQSVINQHCNDKLRVTFDASSPISRGGQGQVYNEFQLLPDRYIASNDIDSFFEICEGLNQDLYYPYCESAVLEQMPVKEIFAKGNTKSKYDMDALSYAIITSHNVFVHVRGLYSSLHRVLMDYHILVKSLENGNDADTIKPYVSWPNVKNTKDAAAFYFTLLICSDKVLGQRNHQEARITAEIYREGIFDKAMT